MKDLYEIAGVSKQAFFQHRSQSAQRAIENETILAAVEEVRKGNGKMGARKMYVKLRAIPIGRDRFERLVLSHGYRVIPPKNYTKTTHRHRRYLEYPNLTAGLQIRRLNQVWVSDLTYYYVNNEFCYVIFEMDVYSRRILGSCASPTLEAIWNVEALEEAFSARCIKTYQYQLIHHSDAGSQYLSDKMIRCLKDRKCRISTCTNVYENAHVERVNGTIKNEYLRPMRIRSIEELRKAVDKAVWHYNHERPHWSLGLMTPVEFEKHILRLPRAKRPVLTMYEEEGTRTDE